MLEANSGDPDQKPHSPASDLGLYYLPMSHKNDARLIWVRGLRSTKALIRLCAYAGWSALMLFACSNSGFLATRPIL